MGTNVRKLRNRVRSHTCCGCRGEDASCEGERSDGEMNIRWRREASGARKSETDEGGQDSDNADPHDDAPAKTASGQSASEPTHRARSRELIQSSVGVAADLARRGQSLAVNVARSEQLELASRRAREILADERTRDIIKTGAKVGITIAVTTIADRASGTGPRAFAGVVREMTRVASTQPTKPMRPEAAGHAQARTEAPRDAEPPREQSMPGPVQSFIALYHYYTNTPVDTRTDAKLVQTLTCSWPYLNDRARTWITGLPQIRADLSAMPPSTRLEADRHWRAVFGVVQGAIAPEDLNARVTYFRDAINVF